MIRDLTNKDAKPIEWEIYKALLPITNKDKNNNELLCELKESCRFQIGHIKEAMLKIGFAFWYMAKGDLWGGIYQPYFVNPDEDLVVRLILTKKKNIEGKEYFGFGASGDIVVQKVTKDEDSYEYKGVKYEIINDVCQFLDEDCKYAEVKSLATIWFNKFPDFSNEDEMLELAESALNGTIYDISDSDVYWDEFLFVTIYDDKFISRSSVHKIIDNMQKMTEENNFSLKSKSCFGILMF